MPVLTRSFWARGDSATANNSYINSTNTNKVPTTKLTFTSGQNGDLRLDQNNGGPDPDTWVQIGNQTYQFRYEFTGNMPTGKKFADVGGLNVQNKQVAVITVLDGSNKGLGTRYYFLKDGSGSFQVMNSMPNGSIPLTNHNPTPPPTLICFADGTKIATPQGDVAVETLQVGDIVTLASGDRRPIRWIGKRTLGAQDLSLYPSLRPIRVPAHTFGTGAPYADLWLSRQHRVLLQGWEVELNFGQNEALVPVGNLVGDRIHVDLDRTEVTYFHLLFDDHEVVLSNGLASESFQPGTYSMDGLEDGVREEIYQLFPELRTELRQDARLSLRGRVATVLAPAEGQVA